MITATLTKQVRRVSYVSTRLASTAASTSDSEVEPSFYNIVKDLDAVTASESAASDRKLNILMMCNKFNGLSKAVYANLTDSGHNITQILEDPTSEQMVSAIQQPHDIILAPFLTKFIPAEVYERSTPCLVVHPGILGDRGASSLDWAIAMDEPHWGVTVLNASPVMDGGDVWATAEFPVRPGCSKASMYRQEVTTWATACINSALADFMNKKSPQPLDYANNQVRGSLLENMKKKHRSICWDTDSTDVVIKKIRMSDSSPGATSVLSGRPVFLYNAQPYMGHRLNEKAGEIAGISQKGDVLVKTIDGAVWIGHAKDPKQKLKLPAASLLGLNEKLEATKRFRGPTDIWAEYGQGELQDVCFIHFNCYNGAMSTEQCKRLKAVLQKTKQNKRAKVICLMGGTDFFSNGIHLNSIEASSDPAQESWHNINAIDDVVREMFTCPDQLVVSVLQGSAGAGGAMMALAADEVIAHRGVTLSPSYKPMALYGSEYWTFFLPQRAGGRSAAEAIASSTLPMSAKTAYMLGLVNKVVGNDVYSLNSQLKEELLRIKSEFAERVEQKQKCRTSAWYKEAELCREKELKNMIECFSSAEYEAKRSSFVYH